MSHIENGVERLRTRWPQSHAVPGEHGYHLIVVPTVILPPGYHETICTVLFVTPPGYPAAHPAHFFTDIDIRLKDDLSMPYRTVQSHPVHGGNFPSRLWPQWKHCMWWSWRLQAWDPNRSNLYTYMKVIQQRLDPAR